MRCRIVSCAGAALLVLSMSACSMTARTAGPLTWIDQPLDGTHFSMQAVTFQAHASDEDGVNRIEFSVAESVVSSVPTGGGRLAEAIVQWSPPGPGIYIITASAQDGRGNVGSKTSVQIVVDGPGVTTATPAAQNAATVAAALTIPPSPTFTPAPASAAPAFALAMNANCRAGPGTAYDNIDTLFQGQVLSLQGRNENGTWLRVQKASGSGYCWVSVITGAVIGDLDALEVVSAPSPPQPLPSDQEPGPGHPLPLDTTPPQIYGLSASPTSIETQGCGEPSTSVVTASVSDAGGVSRVVARVSGGGEVEMSAAGGDVYQALIGPFYDGGQYAVTVAAWDGAGNISEGGAVTIMAACVQ